MKALICLHGLLSTKSDFNRIQFQLKEYYDKIVCYDLPGHGGNTLPFQTKTIQKFLVDIYDSLRMKYKTIDLIGYSMGGVFACYLQSVRNIHKMVLLAPSYHYLNLKNYHFSFQKTKKQPTISSVLPKKNYLHILRFVKIMSDFSDEFHVIYPETMIIWGKDDYLVKETSGILLYQMIHNPNRRYIELANHNHYNITKSPIVLDYIYHFLTE